MDLLQSNLSSAFPTFPTIDPLELISLVSVGKTTTVQFKRTLENREKLAAELCAFANTQGGLILFGVEDDGTISGLAPEEVRRLNSDIATVAADRIREPIYPTSEVVTVQGKNVLVVRVSESDSKPHFDPNGSIWVKSLGDKRRVTSREELRRIFQDAHVFYADEQPVSRTSLADMDTAAFTAFYHADFKQAPESTGLPLATLTENLNLSRNGSLTLTGLLFFGQQPQRYRPELVTKAICYRGTDAATATGYQDSEDIDGTLPQQFAKAKAFIARNLRRPQGDAGINSTGAWEIPEQVFEELLVNMLVHRNYFVAAPNKLFIFDDRVEIHSPGCLPNSLTVEQVKAGNSIPRNPILQSYASKLLPYRGIGTGIRRALALHPRTELFNDTEENRFRIIALR